MERLKAYLSRLEANRIKDEPLNRKAYQDARELSALLSLAEHGNKEIQKTAKRLLRLK